MKLLKIRTVILFYDSDDDLTMFYLDFAAIRNGSERTNQIGPGHMANLFDLFLYKHTIFLVYSSQEIKRR